MSTNYPDDIGQYNTHPNSPFYIGADADERKEQRLLDVLESVWLNHGYELSQAVNLVWSGEDPLEGAAIIRELMERENSKLVRY
jgi:hypothetical protein